MRISVQAVSELDEAACCAWRDVVNSDPAATIYHGKQWCDVVDDAFSKKNYLVHAQDSDGQWIGLLPLTHIRSRLLGSRLVSMPYANYGGTLAADIEVADGIREAAVNLGSELGVSCVELRETMRSPGSQRFTSSQRKVIMLRALPASMEELGKQIGAKRRSQAGRAIREGAQVAVGSTELLPDFYKVFCRNMRDLGTPVYPIRFFDAIMRHCADKVTIIVISLQGEIAAACFLMRWHDTMEIPWAASNRDFNQYGVNMSLYWEALDFAIRQGCGHFDFGRTTPGSGTYKFKKQWGAEELQCQWRGGPESDTAAEAGKVQTLASSVWKNLPLPIANRIGPWISGDLPW